MPELPEVETLRRGLIAHVLGRRITGVQVREARLRALVPDRIHQLRGATICSVRRRAKYLCVDLDNGLVLLVHLGMSGRVVLVPAGKALLPHDRLSIELDDGSALRLNDPRRFSLVDVFTKDAEATHPRLALQGVDPLGSDLRAEALWQGTRGGARPIKAWLLDGRQIAGIGNIYASESLFLARIHPAAKVGRLSLKRWQALVAAIRTTLAAAIDSGGTTLRDFRSLDGEAGYFAHALLVYGREGLPCSACGKPIGRIRQAGRSTYYCKSCQRT